MHFLLAGVVILVMTLLPQLWAQSVLKRYARKRSDIRMSGGQLARELVRKLRMPQVKIEASPMDHYDPETKTLRLRPENLEGRSLTAIVSAAHETAHAVQHKTGYRPLHVRGRLVRVAQVTERIAPIALLATPLIMGATRSPVLGMWTMVVAVGSIALGTIVHLVTLPVELDASFRRALPILQAGAYISPRDYAPAKRILTACALTYVASSLASLLNVWRWLRVLRR